MAVIQGTTQFTFGTLSLGMLHKLVSRGEMRVVKMRVVKMRVVKMRVVKMRRTQFLGPFVEVLQFQQGISKL